MSYFTRVKKYNKNHDPKTGRFSSGPGGGSASPNSISSYEKDFGEEILTTTGWQGGYVKDGRQIDFVGMSDGTYQMQESDPNDDMGPATVRGTVTARQYQDMMKKNNGRFPEAPKKPQYTAAELAEFDRLKHKQDRRWKALDRLSNRIARKRRAQTGLDGAAELEQFYSTRPYLND